MDNWQDYRQVQTLEDKVNQGAAISIHDLPPLFNEGDPYVMINFVDHVQDIETGDVITVGTPLIRRTLGYMDEALYHLFRMVNCSEEIATVSHNLNCIPLCMLYTTEHAAGVTGAGEGPGGGGRVIQQPARFEAVDNHTVKVYSTPAFAGTPEVIKISGKDFAFVYPGTDTNLFLTMR